MHRVMFIEDNTVTLSQGTGELYVSLPDVQIDGPVPQAWITHGDGEDWLVASISGPYGMHLVRQRISNAEAVFIQAGSNSILRAERIA